MRLRLAPPGAQCPMPMLEAATHGGADEGRVVVFSAAFRPFCEPLLAGFAAQHPGIEVAFVDGISGTLHQRYLDALVGGRGEVDVLWSSAMDLQMDLAQSGHAQACPGAAGAGAPASSPGFNCLSTLMSSCVSESTPLAPAAIDSTSSTVKPLRLVA